MYVCADRDLTVAVHILAHGLVLAHIHVLCHIISHVRYHCHRSAELVPLLDLEPDLEHALDQEAGAEVERPPNLVHVHSL